MSDPFGAIYAGAYDALYHEKDYVGEVDSIEAAIRTYGRGETKEILDLGCGTGRHAFILGERGYAIVGVDRSEAMLNKARLRATVAGLPSVEFIEGDVRTVKLDRTFDAVLLMFAVLGYQLSDADVTATLDTVRRHLRPGGVLLCDFWYGPAVESQGPTERTKTVRDGSTVIERTAVGTLHRHQRTCTVHYRLRVTRADGTITEATEEHTVRYFDEAEISVSLGRAGLQLLSVSAFPDVAQEADTLTWNAFAVAKPS